MVAVMIMRRDNKVGKSFWQKTLEALAKTPGLKDESVVDLLENPGTAAEVFDKNILEIYERFEKVSFERLPPEDLHRLIQKMKKRFNSRPNLVEFYENIRRFNRLNHRKLFLVESPGGEACMFLGGRNLGDHYLAWHHDSFIDGDVLYCRHHKNSQGDPIKQAVSSFLELKKSFKDDVLGKKEDSRVSHYAPQPNFQFRDLIVPAWARSVFALKGTTQGIPTDRTNNLPDKERTLLEPFLWKDLLPIHGDSLVGTYDWQVIRVNWQPKAENDRVRKALVEAIRRETEEIYIETAYAEFNDTLRDAIEQALQRGVKVKLVTNGLFVSDGPSKLIRVFMGLWLRDMQVKYGKTNGAGKFEVLFASLEAGHMIHFKGAGFRCQVENGKEPYRTFLIGSHNFHPRSGYSDKEHVLQWKMDAKPGCRAAHGFAPKGVAAAKDLIDYREEFYVDVQDFFHGKMLMTYPTLRDELLHVLALDDKKASKERKRRAKLLLKSLYREDGTLRGGRRTEVFLELLREGGMRDFLGIVL
jgi:phosphatidylserine/phosphatidylglycerophosphate/cardiolipin synthase-like enzyme